MAIKLEPTLFAAEIVNEFRIPFSYPWRFHILCKYEKLQMHIAGETCFMGCKMRMWIFSNL
jgi:hypothetical protein